MRPKKYTQVCILQRLVLLRNDKFSRILQAYFNRPSHKSHNASDKYPKVHHFITEKCAHVHIPLQSGAFWDMRLLGLYSLRRRRLTGIDIPMINLRRSDDRLRFIMGITILIRRRLLNEEAQNCRICATGLWRRDNGTIADSLSTKKQPWSILLNISQEFTNWWYNHSKRNHSIIVHIPRRLLYIFATITLI